MRLAWFSPMPPVPSGIAACSAELVAALATEHEIDVYVDEPVARWAVRFRARQLPRSAHEFVWRHRLRPYDLTVYQVGNSSHHDYLWPYLFRYPGLDGAARRAPAPRARGGAAAHQTRRRLPRRVRREPPGVRPDLAELAIAGFDNHLYYDWPMTRLVVEASRLTARARAGAGRRLQLRLPDARVRAIRLGARQQFPDEAELRRRASARQRRAHGSGTRRSSSASSAD